MKAIVQERYGSADVLKLAEVECPIPADDEVLVRVYASSMHADVWHVMTGLPYVLRLMGSGLWRPINPVPGTDLAGIVEAVGSKVTRFAAGDEVFGETIRGIQWVNGGAFAELASVPESGLAHKPPNVSFVEAAAVPTAALIALSNVRDAGGIRPGMRVLINGAGGGVGMVLVQLAKAFGAHVTGVDCADKLGLLRGLGADDVIDYLREDFTRGSARYDLIVDIPGNHPFSACRRALTAHGKYVLIGHDNYGRGRRRVLGLIPRMMGLMFVALFSTHLPRPSFATVDKAAAMEQLRALLAAGKLTPRVDRTFTLGEVPEAMRYLQGGKAQGKIVIDIEGS